MEIRRVASSSRHAQLDRGGRRLGGVPAASGVARHHPTDLQAGPSRRIPQTDPAEQLAVALSHHGPVPVAAQRPVPGVHRHLTPAQSRSRVPPEIASRRRRRSSPRRPRSRSCATRAATGAGSPVAAQTRGSFIRPYGRGPCLYGGGRAFGRDWLGRGGWSGRLGMRASGGGGAGEPARAAAGRRGAGASGPKRGDGDLADGRCHMRHLDRPRRSEPSWQPPNPPNPRECRRMPANPPESPRIPANASECQRIPANPGECRRIPANPVTPSRARYVARASRHTWGHFGGGWELVRPSARTPMGAWSRNGNIGRFRDRGRVETGLGAPDTRRRHPRPRPQPAPRRQPAPVSR